MCSSIPRGHMPQQSHKRPRPELRADGSSSTQKGFFALSFVIKIVFANSSHS